MLAVCVILVFDVVIIIVLVIKEIIYILRILLAIMLIRLLLLMMILVVVHLFAGGAAFVLPQAALKLRDCYCFSAAAVARMREAKCLWEKRHFSARVGAHCARCKVCTAKSTQLLTRAEPRERTTLPMPGFRPAFFCTPLQYWWPSSWRQLVLFLIAFSTHLSSYAQVSAYCYLPLHLSFSSKSILLYIIL